MNMPEVLEAIRKRMVVMAKDGDHICGNYEFGKYRVSSVDIPMDVTKVVGKTKPPYHIKVRVKDRSDFTSVLEIREDMSWSFGNMRDGYTHFGGDVRKDWIF